MSARFNMSKEYFSFIFPNIRIKYFKIQAHVDRSCSLAPQLMKGINRPQLDSIHDQSSVMIEFLNQLASKFKGLQNHILSRLASIKSLLSLTNLSDKRGKKIFSPSMMHPKNKLHPHLSLPFSKVAASLTFLHSHI